MKIKQPETAVFGAGCFWCVEAVFSRLRGVESVTSGYTGGTVADPAYEDVCGGKTGHAEAVKIEFDPTAISYETLLNVFFHTHDPTTPNRQGADSGNQYRSIILYTTEEQKAAAKKFIKKLTDEKEFEKPVVTEIKPLEDFYPAENYHQKYYNKDPLQPYCQFIITPKLAKFRERYARLLKE